MLFFSGSGIIDILSEEHRTAKRIMGKDSGEESGFSAKVEPGDKTIADPA